MSTNDDFSMLDIALNFHHQKSLRLYDVSVRRNLIIRSEGRKFFTSILWRINLTLSIFIFLATIPILLISLRKCLYLMCVKTKKRSRLLRVARIKTHNVDKIQLNESS